MTEMNRVLVILFGDYRCVVVWTRDILRYRRTLIYKFASGASFPNLFPLHTFLKKTTPQLVRHI